MYYMAGKKRRLEDPDVLSDSVHAFLGSVLGTTGLYSENASHFTPQQRQKIETLTEVLESDIQKEIKGVNNRLTALEMWQKHYATEVQSSKDNLRALKKELTETHLPNAETRINKSMKGYADSLFDQNHKYKTRNAEEIHRLEKLIHSRSTPGTYNDVGNQFASLNMRP